MVSINPRSVLRPEYHHHTDRLGFKLNYVPSSSRWGTNTAPIYALDIPSNTHKRQSPRKSLSHTISSRTTENYFFRDSSGPNRYNLTGEMCNPALRTSSLSIPLRMDYSHKMDSKYDYSSYRSSSSYNSRYNDSVYSSSRRHTSSDVSTEKPTSSKLTGQAEQVRRSRESTTFSLIDNELSKPPLSQIREMYLQNRCSSSCTSGSNASRTTKKANLSVVHTVVRFRVGDYLVGLREHMNKLLDILAGSSENGSRIQSDLKPDTLSSFPCSGDCEFCHRLDKKMPSSQHTKRQSSKRHFSTTHPYMTPSRCFPSETSPRTYNATTTISSHSFKNLDAECSDTKTEHSSPSEESISPKFEESLEEESSPKFPDDKELLKITPLPPLIDDNVTNENKRNPLNSPQLTQPRLKLNSTAQRLCDELANMDWSANGIDFGPCGETSADFHDLFVEDPLLSEFENKLLSVSESNENYVNVKREPWKQLMDDISSEIFLNSNKVGVHSGYNGKLHTSVPVPADIKAS